MALNDFNYIAIKIRKITRRLSANELTDAELLDYINSFLVYDLSNHLRLFYNRQTYSFQLTPNVGIYSIATFKNQYITFEPPAYIDGYQLQYMQDSQAFYQMYPRLKYSVQLTTGTGAVGVYAGTYTYVPIEPNTVVISTVDTTGASIVATDNGTGGLIGNVVAGGTVNYATGAIANITWTSAPAAGQPIYMSANEYRTSRPYTVLYFNNAFYFWPFPDRAYTFRITTYKNPEACTSITLPGATYPELNQWADLIAYGTSLKILADNLDMENYAKVQILFDEAQRLVERRTLKQLSTQRAATIYGDATNWPGGSWGYPYL